MSETPESFKSFKSLDPQEPKEFLKPQEPGEPNEFLKSQEPLDPLEPLEKEKEEKEKKEKGREWIENVGKNMIKGVSFDCGGLTIHYLLCKTCYQMREEHYIVGDTCVSCLFLSKPKK